MINATALLLGLAALAVVVPLVHEYGLLRRDLGLGRLGALLAVATLFPALAAGLAVGLPLHATPVLQWTVTVTATLVLYSLGVAALRPALATARRSS